MKVTWLQKEWKKEVSRRKDLGLPLLTKNDPVQHQMKQLFKKQEKPMRAGK